MPLNATRILCVGEDRTLLTSRCLILNNEGYNAETSNVHQAYQALQVGNFDVVIMDGAVAKKHGELVSDCPVNTSSMVIEGFLFPSQLLAALKQKLAVAASPANRQEHGGPSDGGGPRDRQELPSRSFDAGDNFVV